MPQDPEEEQPFKEFRVPPQDLEAEQSVLGAMLLSPEAIEIAVGILEHDYFYREAHSVLFLALKALHLRKEPADMVTVASELRLRGHFETFGGASALTALIERVPTAANCEYYANIVKEKALGRRLIRVGTEIVQDAYDDNVHILELLSTAVERVEKATNLTGIMDGQTTETIIQDVEAEVASYLRGEKHYFISSGFYAFDHQFGGWERGKFTLVRGRPKEGKTLLIHNSSLQIAACHLLYENKPKMPVGYIYLDSHEKDMIYRSLALMLDSEIKKIVTLDKTLQPLQTPRALDYLKELPWHLKGQSSFGQDADKYLGWIRRVHREHGIDIFFWDSVSVLQWMPTREKNLERLVAEFANKLVSLAAQENIAIVAISEVANDQENGFKSKYSGRWEYAAYATYDVIRRKDEKTEEFTDVMEVKAALHRGSMYGTALFYGKDKQFRLKNYGAGCVGGYGDKNCFRKDKGGTDD